jgi:hypothetical protein
VQLTFDGTRIRHRVLFQVDGFNRELTDRIREDEGGRKIDIDKQQAIFLYDCFNFKKLLVN